MLEPEPGREQGQETGMSTQSCDRCHGIWSEAGGQDPGLMQGTVNGQVAKSIQKL